METPNPWIGLEDKAPYVLEGDRAAVEAYNGKTKADSDYYIHTDVVPEPFFGNIEAPLVVLLLNPGFCECDCVSHAKPSFRARLFLAIQSGSRPHFHLDAGAEGPGMNWWERRAGKLIEDLGREFVAANMLAVQFFPYKSKRFSHGCLRVPSQAYSFALVEKAIKRSAFIICARSKRLWMDAVPSLAQYEHAGRFAELKNPRNVYISRRNLTEPVYNEVLQYLRKNRLN